MRLELRDIIHVPDAKKAFQFQLDLSQEEFYGNRPIVRPVQVEGCVTNHAGALVLEGTACSVLDLVCDRCGKEFSREKVVVLDNLVAQELEDEENDDILLLDGTELDLDGAVTTAFILAMDTKNLCSDDCKGLCAKCGADLNPGPCGCRPDVDPRLAALAQLLDKEAE
ncbi:DUF177 domain-containing protein [Pseudoflavonifractor sp. 60]|uniref:YceD family protein n=1 Tax=Pseudoflavonifractor sp. 60 TaxID=2304576 RepID=UPI001371E54F|nr:DUF177 domain-containing protein [Pseudoflavonifractor sp. 60]NBI67412.1 DUF177 domain-containing protein [Pseudoflavonifractor sp. 60]